jgi:hypothetical protein
MPKSNKPENYRTPIRVLNITSTKGLEPAAGKDSDALADAIRRSWTQKKAKGR